MAYGVYSDRGYREHILERSKNTNKTEVFTQEDQSFTGRKTFISGVTTSDLKVQTVEVSESLKVKGKDIIDVTAGATIPIGTIHHYIGIVAPEGYLMCDKSYNATDYPQLWAVLPDSLKNFDTGTFDIDFRELVIVGAGQNAKLDIKAHDVYELGQFKDDQLQTHKHYRYGERRNGWNIQTEAGGSTGFVPIDSTNYNNGAYVGEPASCREGSTTHGKQIGLNYIIKY